MHIDEKEVDTRDVAAWTSEAGDKAGCDWIDAASEDDRDRRGRTFRRDSRWAADGSNHIDTVGDEIGGHCGQPIIVSFRKAGNRVRITAQLIDAESGAHLWADRFDGSLEDVFDIQDKVASSVAGVIEPALQAAETARASSRSTSDLTAYDLYLRAYAVAMSSKARVPEALRLAEEAIARDPHYGPALAWAAFCCFRLLFDDRSEDPVADRLKGT